MGPDTIGIGVRKYIELPGVHQPSPGAIFLAPNSVLFDEAVMGFERLAILFLPFCFARFLRAFAELVLQRLREVDALSPGRGENSRVNRDINCALCARLLVWADMTAKAGLLLRAETLRRF